jgi:hypothetical protein
MEFTGKDLQFHEAANIFPLINGAEFEALVEDVKINGVRESVKILDGLVLDGRNRYRASLLANKKPQFEHVTTSDPVGYVLSLNLHRRHLTPSQASMCAARAREIYEREAKERQVRKSQDSVPENLPEQKKGDARDIAGKAFNVSGKTVDHATRVIEKGIPELAKAVDEGRMAVSTAAILATEKPEIQRKTLEDPKLNRVYKKDHNKPKRASGNEGRTEYERVASTNMQYARLAILQLDRIDTEQNDWLEAVAEVSKWIENKRAKNVR